MSARPSVIFVVSRKSIKVLSTGYWRRTTPKSVEAEFPRNVRLGPVDTHQVPSFTLCGVVYEIDEEYIAVVNAADLDRTGVDAMPPDPLPDL